MAQNVILSVTKDLVIGSAGAVYAYGDGASGTRIHAFGGADRRFHHQATEDIENTEPGAWDNCSTMRSHGPQWERETLSLLVAA